MRGSKCVWDVVYARTQVTSREPSPRHSEDSDRKGRAKGSRKHANGAETEECEARKGLAPLHPPDLRQPRRHCRVRLRRQTAAPISQMLAIHHRRWPFIRIVTPAATCCFARSHVIEAGEARRRVDVTCA